MKILPTTFRKHGFDYEQAMRQGNIAIYRQTKHDQSWERFEVGIIQQNEARNVFGKHFEASESWLSSEQWGILAYTCLDLARANERAASFHTKRV